MWRAPMRWVTEVRSGWKRLGRALRVIIGAPDYERYVEHCRAAGHAALPRAEYVRQALSERGGRPRCC